jgi:hypothetical protein
MHSRSSLSAAVHGVLSNMSEICVPTLTMDTAWTLLSENMDKAWTLLSENVDQAWVRKCRAEI